MGRGMILRFKSADFRNTIFNALPQEGKVHMNERRADQKGRIALLPFLHNCFLFSMTTPRTAKAALNKIVTAMAV